MAIHWTQTRPFSSFHPDVYFPHQTHLIESTHTPEEKKKIKPSYRLMGDPTNWSVKLSVRLLKRTVGGRLASTVLNKLAQWGKQRRQQVRKKIPSSVEMDGSL